MGVDLKRPFAGGIKTVTSEGFGQPDHAKATAISLLGMAALTHDNFDKGLDVWPDAYGLPPDALWCPIFTETVMRGHVIADRGMLAIA
tara:strand:- start:57 stop:320 length:264 start_codon:yes stop_codon:yes gene_type:complete